MNISHYFLRVNFAAARKNNKRRHVEGELSHQKKMFRALAGARGTNELNKEAAIVIISTCCCWAPKIKSSKFSSWAAFHFTRIVLHSSARALVFDFSYLAQTEPLNWEHKCEKMKEMKDFPLVILITRCISQGRKTNYSLCKVKCRIMTGGKARFQNKCAI